ncbi:phosphatase PAP2 family protein [Streptomyces sp. NPDC020800]|uniref:phosphatase PAP2 family protein n=1 Tax=Streptomyces sp. NPDC020800 TaxID=3365092 RepID=UPI0037B9C056
MILALTGSSVDGPLFRDVVDLAHRAPGPLDGVVTVWSAHGTAVFALLMAVCAPAMAVCRVRVGVHCPHDVLAGALLGGLVSCLVMTVLRRWPRGLAGRLARTRLRPLLVS